MSLQLYGHLFSLYCQKALIALYEIGTPFRFRAFGPNYARASMANRAVISTVCSVVPAFGHLKAYRARLLSRPSVARAVDEARPYRSLFPLGAPDRD